MELTKRQIEFLGNFEEQLGILSLALERSGVTRKEYDGWLNNLEFKKEVIRVEELAVDFVENRLLQLINEGDLQAIQFYLKTKAKKRGY